jgi:uncharacterized protein (UPF0276 family)
MVLLATTYEGDSPELLAAISGVVDAIEITPDTIAALPPDGGRARLRSDVLAEYQSLSSGVRFVAHGVGLSIGSHDAWNDSYLDLLDELVDRLPIDWHSEHLACTTVDGENLGTMLALPRTSEALDLVCERIDRIQNRYQKEFLIEHVIRLLPEPDAEFSDAAFLNELVQRSGCGLILDAYNLECDRFNYGFEVAGFLDELNTRAVREIHVAGGATHAGFQLDIHSRVTADSTLELAREILRRSPFAEMVTYEFLREAIPSLGVPAIAGELKRIREALLQ